MTDRREYDLVLFGATGYTGRLTAAYLARNAPPDLNWAIVGRNREALAALAESLALRHGVRPAVLQADALDDTSVGDLTRSTRVVCTTVGPYARYGHKLVAACADNGTHYCDLTAETAFVRESIDRNHERATATGARIVHSCGFDSVPSDLGVLLLAEHFRERGARLRSATTFVGPLQGAVSGGTIESLMAIQEGAERDPQVRKLLADPDALAPVPSGAPQPAASSVRFDTRIGEWTAPYVMANYNQHLVRRSSHLLDYRAGESFEYREVTATGSGPSGLVKAGLLAAGVGALFAATNSERGRRAVRPFLPSPGQGPSPQQLSAGHFRYRILGEGTGTDGRQLTATAIVGAFTDPGYSETAKMLAESGLVLATELGQLRERAGVVTPASAIGMPLVQRLRGAGMTFLAVTTGY